MSRVETIFTLGAETARSLSISGERLAMIFFVCAGRVQHRASRAIAQPRIVPPGFGFPIVCKRATMKGHGHRRDIQDRPHKATKLLLVQRQGVLQLLAPRERARAWHLARGFPWETSDRNLQFVQRVE